MKQYVVHWTYEVVPLPAPEELECEVFLTFHPEPVLGSWPLTLTAEDVRDWFFPDLYQFTAHYDIYDDEREAYEVIQVLDYWGVIGAVICRVLNADACDHGGLVAPLEERAFQEWEKFHPA